MVANHTPGPWLANKWGHRLDKIVIESDEFFIAEVNFCSRQEANARLIAAAPELLQALQLIASTDPIDAMLDPQRATRVAREAVAKATGEQV